MSDNAWKCICGELSTTDYCRKCNRDGEDIANIEGAKALEQKKAELENQVEKLKAIKDRHTMNAIMRICPDCGDDKCGDNHDVCYKCILRGVLTVLNTGDIQKGSLLHMHIREVFKETI